MRLATSRLPVVAALLLGAPAAGAGAPDAPTSIASGAGTEVVVSGAFRPATPAKVHPLWPSIPDATWVWTSEAVVAGEAREGTGRARFRHLFEVACPSAEAVLRITADNAYRARLDGAELAGDGVMTADGADESWRTIEERAVPLRAGRHELAVEVVSYGLPGGDPATNPAGLLYRLAWRCGASLSIEATLRGPYGPEAPVDVVFRNTSTRALVILPAALRLRFEGPGASFVPYPGPPRDPDAGARKLAPGEKVAIRKTIFELSGDGVWNVPPGSHGFRVVYAVQPGRNPLPPTEVWVGTLESAPLMARRE